VVAGRGRSTAVARVRGRWCGFTVAAGSRSTVRVRGCGGFAVARAAWSRSRVRAVGGRGVAISVRGRSASGAAVERGLDRGVAVARAVRGRGGARSLGCVLQRHVL